MQETAHTPVDPDTGAYPRIYGLTLGLRVLLVVSGMAAASVALLYLADLAVAVIEGKINLPSSLAAAILLLSVFAGSAALGGYWVLTGLRAKLILHADAIEWQGGLWRRRLRRDQIAGRWAEPAGAAEPDPYGTYPRFHRLDARFLAWLERKVWELIPREAGQRGIWIGPQYRGDGALDAWLRSLPVLQDGRAARSTRRSFRQWLPILACVAASIAIVAKAIANQGALLMPPSDIDGVIAAYYYGMTVHLFVLGTPAFLVSLATLAYPYRSPVGVRTIVGRPVVYRSLSAIGCLVGGLLLLPVAAPQYPHIVVAKDQIFCGGQSLKWREISAINCCSRERFGGKSARYAYFILKPGLGPPMRCDVANGLATDLRPIGQDTIYRVIRSAWERER